MWFADVVCNVAWFASAAGTLGEPRSRSEVATVGAPGSATLLIYGSDAEVFHLRAMMDVATYEEADACTNENIQHWSLLLQVGGSLAGSPPPSPEVLPNQNAFMVIIGPGGEMEPSVTLKVEELEPASVDYKALAESVSSWQTDSTAELFYFSRFLDGRLPVDVRWLNGYRVAEWHFQQGKGDLSKNQDWRKLLESIRPALAEHLRPQQTLHGFFESVRVLAAHAVRDGRPLDARLRRPGEPVTWTFAALEQLVMTIMNQKLKASSGVRLTPKVPNPSIEATRHVKR